MTKVLELKKSYPETYRKLSDTFNNKFFPCLYGKMSFLNNLMYAGLYPDTKEDSIRLLAKDLREMSLHLDNQSKIQEMKFNTFIAVFDIDDREIDFDKLWYKIISNLHKKDLKKWKTGSTKDLNNADFKFSFDNKLWYPVLITPSHPSKIRKSKITILSFQPDQTFLLNKEIDNDFYQNMRKKIHLKINKLYQGKEPYYLSSESTGKGIVQFLGYDFQNDDKSFQYPDLF